MTNMTFMRSPDPGSERRRARVIAVAQAMLDHLAWADQHHRGSAHEIAAASARRDRVVAELERQVTDPTPREVLVDARGTVTFAW